MQINGVSCSSEYLVINSAYKIIYKPVAQSFKNVPASLVKAIALGMGLDMVGHKDNNND
ncbi:MAG: hypothetical protein RLZZ215_2371 [Pseudomonadota bacterium]|jgi:hypothetical protein